MTHRHSSLSFLPLCFLDLDLTYFTSPLQSCYPPLSEAVRFASPPTVFAQMTVLLFSWWGRLDDSSLFFPLTFSDWWSGSELADCVTLKRLICQNIRCIIKPEARQGFSDCTELIIAHSIRSKALWAKLTYSLTAQELSISANESLSVLSVLYTIPLYYHASLLEILFSQFYYWSALIATYITTVSITTTTTIISTRIATITNRDAFKPFVRIMFLVLKTTDTDNVFWYL